VIVALASPRIASSIDDGLERIERLVRTAASASAQIVCLPEAYLPGLRGMDFEVCPFGESERQRVVTTVSALAHHHCIAIILGTEQPTTAGRHVAALVINRDGTVQGTQTKNQLDPTEDAHYVPGHTRQIFEVDGVKFGIAICHEGFRYPETVRWAAARGARVVFHPHLTGSDRQGRRLEHWGDPAAPYYEQAMRLRALENTIYFASVNYALQFQESATSIIRPDGTCQAFLPYGEEGVLVEAIDLEAATGKIATRYAPDRYRDPT
jgi:predicted amidohydrolase